MVKFCLHATQKMLKNDKETRQATELKLKIDMFQVLDLRLL